MFPLQHGMLEVNSHGIAVQPQDSFWNDSGRITRDLSKNRHFPETLWIVLGAARNLRGLARPPSTRTLDETDLILTWVSHQVISIHNYGFLTKIFGNVIKHPDHFLKTCLIVSESIETWRIRTYILGVTGKIRLLWWRKGHTIGV